MALNAVKLVMVALIIIVMIACLYFVFSGFERQLYDRQGSSEVQREKKFMDDYTVFYFVPEGARSIKYYRAFFGSTASVPYQFATFEIDESNWLEVEAGLNCVDRELRDSFRFPKVWALSWWRHDDRKKRDVIFCRDQALNEFEIYHEKSGDSVQVWVLGFYSLW